MFFYSDTGPRSNIQINVWKMNAVKAYMRHYENLLFLDFMAKNGTRQERIQAEQEMVICRRKLTFWKRHPNFNKNEVMRLREQMNKSWRKTA